MSQPQSLSKYPRKRPKYPAEGMDPHPTLAQPLEKSKDIIVYRDLRKREKVWMDSHKIEQLGNKLITWALSNPEAVIITDFFLEHGILPKQAWDWTQKWESFANDYAYAKTIIGNRREKGGLSKLYDAGIVRFTMPLYNQEWLKETERMAKLTKDDNKLASSQAINVVMQRYLPEDLKIEGEKK